MNPFLLRWQADSLPLSHLGIPKCNSHVTRKKIAIEYTQKGIRKEFKRFHYKNKLNTKEDGDDGNEGQKPKAYGKQIAKWQS